MIAALIEDLLLLSRPPRSPKTLLSTALFNDSFAILALTRTRELARRWHLIGVNRLLRLWQTAFYGIEIGKDVVVGKGVYFVHPLGTVLGGDAEIGDRVRFMGNSTVGTAKDNGYPVIEADVLVGCGARILGPIRIGARSVIGANAVVLTDIPADSVAVGVPASARAATHSPYDRQQLRVSAGGEEAKIRSHPK